MPIAYEPVLVTEFAQCLRAGFPSPAEDLGGRRIDILERIVKHPAATYALTIRGNSMVDYGIFDHDTVLVDRAIRPRHGHIVVANLDNEFTCKYLWKRNGTLKLKAGNETYPDIVPRDGQELLIWGIVLTSIKQFLI